MRQRVSLGLGTKLCAITGALLVAFNALVFFGLTITALSGPSDNYPFALLFIALSAIGPAIAFRRWRRAGEAAALGEVLCSLVPGSLVLAVLAFLLLGLSG